jgi:hypothetical protein
LPTIPTHTHTLKASFFALSKFFFSFF